MKRQARIPRTAALWLTAAALLLSAFVVVPPWSMGTLVLVVAVTELSPLVAAFDVLALLVVARLLREHTRLRLASIVLLALAASVALRPMARFPAAARSAATQLGAEVPVPRFSPLAAIRGGTAPPSVAERIVPYRAADGSPLSMHVYSGQGTGARLRPVVVVIYGGAWRSGDPTQAANVSRLLASRGFVVAALDYRHAPHNRFPSQLDDVRAGLALLRDSAAAWRVDTARVALLGRSSGGQLAELAGWTPGPLAVRAVVAIYSPFDLSEGYRDLPRPDPIGVRDVLRAYLGGTPDERPAAYHDASPSRQVRPALPPTLLVYGARDHVVKAGFNREAATALRRAGVPVVSLELPWAEHGFDLVPAGLGGQLTAAVLVTFLEGRLAVRSP